MQEAHASLDYLLSQGLATRGHLALQTASAGGVLGALLLQGRPEDFGAAALRMPFLDLFTVMTDPSHSLTQHEWDEWGNPNEPGGSYLLWDLCPYAVSLFPGFLLNIARWQSTEARVQSGHRSRSLVCH